MKIRVDNKFLQKQWEPSGRGCLVCVDKNLAEKVERSRLRKWRKCKENRLHLLHHMIVYRYKNLEIVCSSDEESFAENIYRFCTDYSVRKKRKKGFNFTLTISGFNLSHLKTGWRFRQMWWCIYFTIIRKYLDWFFLP